MHFRHEDSVGGIDLLLYGLAGTAAHSGAHAAHAAAEENCEGGDEPEDRHVQPVGGPDLVFADVIASGVYVAITFAIAHGFLGLEDLEMRAH